MNICYYAPENNTASTPFSFVFHGDARNAKECNVAAITKTQTKGFTLIDPACSQQNFPNGDGYISGNSFVDWDTTSENPLNPETHWSIFVIEPLFDFVKTQVNNSTITYAVFGQLAGAEFAHRFLMFKPTTRITKAVVSATGRFTFPNTVVFPCRRGQNLLENKSLNPFFVTDSYMQVAEAVDNPNAARLRHTVYADVQGLNRKQRSEN
jgi:hypothetical protein